MPKHALNISSVFFEFTLSLLDILTLKFYYPGLLLRRSICLLDFSQCSANIIVVLHVKLSKPLQNEHDQLLWPAALWTWPNAQCFYSVFQKWNTILKFVYTHTPTYVEYVYILWLCVCVVCFACFYFRNTVENHKLACYFWNAVCVWVCYLRVCVCVGVAVRECAEMISRIKEAIQSLAAIFLVRNA